MPYVKEQVIIGEIKQICTMAGASAPSEYWKELDGSVVSDPASPYNGIRIYNINGGNVELSVTWTADGGGAYCTVADTDINALNIGDRVTGTGITNVNGLPPIITDITGNTVTINNIATTGAITSTFTNDGIYLGGGSDGSIGDQIQNIVGQLNRGSSTEGFVGGQVSTNAGASGAFSISAYKAGIISTGGGFRCYRIDFNASDSTVEGGARTGSRTRPHTRFVKMIMRIK